MKYVNRVDVRPVISGLFGKRFRFGVGAKIFVPFFIITCMVMSAISYFAMTKVSERIGQMERTKASTVLDNTVDRLNEQKKYLELITRVLSDSPELEQAVAQKDYNRIYGMLVSTKYYSSFEKFALYDNTRQLIAEVASGPDHSKDELQYITQGLTGITNSGMEISAQGMELFTVTPVHYDPIKESLKTPIGVLVVEKIIDADDLNEIKKKEGVEINLFHHGAILLSTLDTKQWAGAIPKLLDSIKNGKTYQLVDLGRNKEYVNAWKSLGPEGMISVMVPNDDFLAFSQGFSKDIILTTVLAGILVLASSFALTKIIIRPLVGMLDATNAITCGDFQRKIEISTADEFGRLGHAINFMAEKIAERIEKAEHLATVDGLTGLYNHRYFQQKLEQELKRAHSFKLPLSLILIDIDYFKHYNDTQGHPAGDLVLQEIGKILKQNIRGVDIAARYGGEEFALVLVDTPPHQAVDIGERIRQAVEEFPFGGKSEQPAGNLTVSLGVATYPVNATKKDDLIKMADDALYKAKYISKNRVILYYSVLDELKSDIDRSEHDLLNTVKTLISVINSKDKYTFGHSERVVQYSVMMAEAMQLPGELVKTIKIGAYLHDIGKIEINREILNKEGPLTKAEIETLRQHPSWGAQIVTPINSLKEALPLVLYHHEKYDGSGYPQGLKGLEIPLLARILKVADSFDAMTTARPYRKKMTMEEARLELLNCSGTDFDPDIVDVFIKILDQSDGEVQNRDTKDC